MAKHPRFVAPFFTAAKLNGPRLPNSLVRGDKFDRSSSTKGDVSQSHRMPLQGIRVLELGQLIAGPFAGQLLSQFGAEVIKVEPPGTGDPLRAWRELDVDRTSPWFRSIGRNKKSVAIDLRKEEGRELVKQLAIRSDVLLENFKPGTLEKWSLGPADLHPHNRDLIFTRVSGYGQTGPWSQRPGYASVCEAESGFRYINGFPDPVTGHLAGAPVRPNISLGDSIAGLHAAFGTVLSLLARFRNIAGVDSRSTGRTVDVSIVERSVKLRPPMLNLMEGIIPEYDRKGKIRGPSGSSVTGIVPTNAYPCQAAVNPLQDDDSASPSTPPQGQPQTYVVIGGNGDSIYNRLMQAIGRPDLIGPDFQHNKHRVERQEEIEVAISSWTRQHTADEVVQAMNKAGVPVGRVLNVKEVVQNEQNIARGAIQDVWLSNNCSGSSTSEKHGWTVKMQGTFPVIDGVNLSPRWAGPDLGYHTDQVLKAELNLDQQTIDDLRAKGVIA